MRPLRIELEGFLTHERTVMDFRGDWLWPITGHNGAGKSAIFDAMTFVLYGQHRYKGQHAKLMSQGATYTRVAFDFAVGSQAYRVERTITRRDGKRGPRFESTFQAYGIDPDIPNPEQAVPLSATNSKDGLERWVRETVGITPNAFLSSVLLRQGEAERFIDASSRDRQSILLDLLDLEPYKRLEVRAKERTRELQIRLDDLEKELHPLRTVTQDSVQEAEEHRDRMRSLAERWETAVERAVSSAANANAFEQRQIELDAVREKLASAEEVLREAGVIEAQWNELCRLTRVLPALTEIAERRGKAELARSEAGESQTQANNIDVETLEEEHTGKAVAAGIAKGDYEEARKATRAAHEQMDKLKPLADAGKEAVSLERQNAEARDELSQLRRLLEGFEHAEAHSSQCEAAEAAIPWLAQLLRCRSTARQSDQLRREAEKGLPGLNESAAQLEAEVSDLREKERAAATHVNTLQQELVGRRTELRHAQEDLSSRLDAKDEGTCSRCGQPVDAGHIEREIADAQARVDHFSELVVDLEREAEEIDERAGEFGARAGELEPARDAAVKAVEELQRTVQEETKKRDSALEQAQEAIQVLPDVYRDRSADADYPTSADLAEARRLASQAQAARNVCAELNRQSARAGLLDEQIAERHIRIASVRGAHPDRDLPAALQHYEDLALRIQGMVHKEHEQELTWGAAQREADDAFEVLQQALESRDELLQLASKRRTEADAEVTAIEALANTLRDDWPNAASTTLEALRILIQRKTTLAPVEARKQELDGAREAHTGLEQAAETLRRQVTEIPEEDRIPLHEANDRLEEAKRERDHFHGEAARATDAAARLGEQLGQRTRIERQIEEASILRDDYSALAKHFGRDGLQAWLVQEAHQNIAHEANEFLSKISGGLLRLEMRPRGEDLEIMVTDLSSGEQPLDIEGISGGQRFRVAVALALAIGEYSGGGSRCIRSVLIDEGFGGLDDVGRKEMIDLLKSLSGTLDCVILVSHQESFKEAFPHGYHVEKLDGVSRVTLRGETSAVPFGADDAELIDTLSLVSM